MRYPLLLLLYFSSTSILFAQGEKFAASIQKGAVIYKKNCVVCHSKKGTGKGKRIPPLAQSDFLIDNRIASIKAIKFGLEGKIMVNGIDYDKSMKAVDLSNKEIADVLNYVLNTWGNQSDKMVTEKEVKAIHND